MTAPSDGVRRVGQDTPVETPAATAGKATGSGTRLGRPTTKLGKALKWSYVMSVGGNAIQAVLALAVAAVLGPREYGLMALAMV